MVNRPMVNIFIAPLNWGLGHATRCVPLVEHFCRQGSRVYLGGDGESGEWLKKRFPDLPFLQLEPLDLRYSKGDSQVWAMVRQLPKLIGWMIRDHRRLQTLQAEYHFDCVISDNRFGCWLPGAKASAAPRCIYLTHQVVIPLPKGWRWLEPLAQRLHARIINRYSELWIPDYAEYPGLAGRLSHTRPSDDCLPTPCRPPADPKYIGLLSRFKEEGSKFKVQGSKFKVQGSIDEVHDTVLLLSGLEPHRSMLRDWATEHYPDVEVLEGITDDEWLAQRLLAAKRIIARSGYSTIMDLVALGIMGRDAAAADCGPEAEPHEVVLIPTPGQPEQEYLAEIHAKMHKK